MQGEVSTRVGIFHRKGWRTVALSGTVVEWRFPPGLYVGLHLLQVDWDNGTTGAYDPKNLFRIAE